MEPKINIGDKVFYVEASSNYGKKVPCLICFGKKFAKIILGDDSIVEIECGGCKRGIDSPSGTMTVRQPSAVVREGVITGISMRNGLSYEVGYRNLNWHEIFKDKNKAEKEKEKRLKEVTEQAERHFKDKFKNCTENQLWSVRYHNSCIKSDERSIEWHKMRLNMIKDKKHTEAKDE